MRGAPNEDDRWLFDLRSGQYRLGDGVRGYQTPQGICVDLSDMVLALDLAVRVDKKLRRATGWVFDERRSLTIDREAGTVRVGSASYAIGAATIRDVPAGWCVDLDSLNTWLGVPIVADLSNAVLRIDAKEKLPFQLAAERRARAAGIRPQASFDLASLPQAARPYQAWATPSIDVVASAGFVSDRKGGGTYTQARYEVFAAGEVAGQSFDARLSSDDDGVPDSLRMRLYRTDPEGRLLGPLKATHYAVGDVSLLSTGLVAQSVPGRGAVLTNRPVERPDSFDKTSFRGDLPAGWDAELYRNGQLLAFTTPDGDGRYEFLDVPLQYGSNRFEIVMYGPQGQIRREIRQLQVGIDSIPPQQTWYWAGVAQEDTDLVEFGRRGGAFRRGWRATAGIERGLDTRTSVAGYLHSLMIENVRRNYGEVALRRSIGPSLLEVAGSYADAPGRGGGRRDARELACRVRRNLCPRRCDAGMGRFRLRPVYQQYQRPLRGLGRSISKAGANGAAPAFRLVEDRPDVGDFEPRSVGPCVAEFPCADLYRPARLGAHQSADWPRSPR
jgi:hypothetical protein